MRRFARTWHGPLPATVPACILPPAALSSKRQEIKPGRWKLKDLSRRGGMSAPMPPCAFRIPSVPPRGCGIILLLFPSVLAKPRRTIVSKTDHHSLAVCKYVCTQVGGWSTPSASRPASQKRACQPAQRWQPCNGMQAGYTVATSHTLPSASLPKTRGINSHDGCRVAKTRQHTGEGTAQMPRRCGSTHLSSRINVHYLGKNPRQPCFTEHQSRTRIKPHLNSGACGRRRGWDIPRQRCHLPHSSRLARNLRLVYTVPLLHALRPEAARAACSWVGRGPPGW